MDKKKEKRKTNIWFLALDSVGKLLWVTKNFPPSAPCRAALSAQMFIQTEKCHQSLAVVIVS